jgi:hypothetical protein
MEREIFRPIQPSVIEDANNAVIDGENAIVNRAHKTAKELTRPDMKPLPFSELQVVFRKLNESVRYVSRGNREEYERYKINLLEQPDHTAKVVFGKIYDTEPEEEPKTNKQEDEGNQLA